MSDKAFLDGWLELGELFDEIEVRVTDWTPVTEPFSMRLLKDAREVFQAEGPGDWSPHDPQTTERYGAHPLLRLSGGLHGSLRRSWTPRAAAVYTRSPHAHLMDLGTKRYERPLYQRKDATTVGGRRTRRMSRASVRDRLASGEKGNRHAPPRTFLYIDDLTREAFFDAALDHVIEATEK